MAGTLGEMRTRVELKQHRVENVRILFHCGVSKKNLFCRLQTATTDYPGNYEYEHDDSWSMEKFKKVIGKLQFRL